MKDLRELGSKRRETVWSLSAVTEIILLSKNKIEYDKLGLSLSTQGPEIESQ